MTTLAVETIGVAVSETTARLAAAGVPEPRREARLLVALALGVDPAIVLGYPERPLDGAAWQRLSELAARRATREPFSRLRGHREFWSLDFALSADTLDPRADSETVIEAALDRLPDRRAPLRVVDFGTGTGCLLLALLSEFPDAFGIGIDISPGAAATARRNAASLGLELRTAFVIGAWDEMIRGPVDVILGNPPYIPTAAVVDLAPEVARYEPPTALDGGPDGLDAYRALAPAARRLLAPGGAAFFEVGAGQAARVASLMEAAGLQVEAVRQDLAGVDRCLVLAPPEAASPPVRRNRKK